MYTGMKNMYKAVFILGLLLMAGCATVEEEVESGSAITDFSELKLIRFIGQELTIKGIADRYPYPAKRHEALYKFLDKDGFWVFVSPSKSRNLVEGERYEVTGKVVEDERKGCTAHCEKIYILEES
jgi:hypothetical protein